MQREPNGLVVGVWVELLFCKADGGGWRSGMQAALEQVALPFKRFSTSANVVDLLQ